MPNSFIQRELALLIRLVVAHLVTDFVLQMDSWVEQRLRKKWASGWLYIHGAVAGILAYILAGRWNAFWLPLIIFVTHILLDGLKVKAADTGRSFLLDQLGHFTVILGCWILLVSVPGTIILNSLASLAANIKFWILILVYIAAIWPAGICWVGKFTETWRNEIEDASSQGLEKAGLWIGRLERILILTFVLVKHFEAIGFLIAAKSIFRFGEIRSPDRRKEAEYILIGTMISFLIAIALGIFTNWLLQSAA